MSLVNQDLLYLKYVNSEAKKYVPSLHKIHVFPFPEDDLEELNTSWSQQGHIRRQLKTRDDHEVVYSEKKIVDVVRVQFDQGYGQEYMIEIVVKRADGGYSKFTESDYKYLHKNDIEDISCVYWERVHDYQLGMKIGLIYENNKQEKRVIDIKEIPKFCDATLKRVLEKVKKFNLDVKHSYADPDLRDEDVEYTRFYEEYIQDRLRHRDQMRRWESYVNGRPLE
ncbi:hypothetical protein Tco_0189295 [Tanacetum coccineum]